MPSLIDFNTYKPTFIGKPVEQLGQVMKSTAEFNKRALDTTSTLDMLMSEASENLESSEMIRLDEARNDIKTSLNDLANSTDHRTSDIKLNKMVTNFNTNKGLNAALTKSTNFKKWKDDAHSSVISGKLDRSIYENILDNAKYNPVEADKYGYYNTNIESNYETALAKGNTTGYTFAQKVDLNKVLKDGHSNLMDIDREMPRLALNSQGMAFTEYPATGRYGIGTGIDGKKNYINDLKTILINDQAAVDYMQDIALAKSITPDQVATDMATSYAINNNAIQNLTKYVQYTAPTIEGAGIPTIDMIETEPSVGMSTETISKLKSSATRKQSEAVDIYAGSTGQQYPGTGGVTELLDYNYLTDTPEQKIAMNNIAKYLYNFDLDEHYKNKPTKKDGSIGSYTANKKEDESYKEYINRVNSEKVLDRKLTIPGINKEFKTYNELEDFVFDGINKQLERYNPEQVSTYSEPIPEFIIPSIDDKYTGGRALLQYLIGDNVLKVENSNALVTGEFLKRHYLVEGKHLTGEQFKEQYLDKMDNGTKASINTYYSYKNPFVATTGNKAFSEAFSMNLGNLQVVVSGAAYGTSVRDGKTSLKTLKQLSDIHTLEFKSPYAPLGFGFAKDNYAKVIYEKGDESTGDPGYYNIQVFDKNNEHVKTYNVSDEINVHRSISKIGTIIENSINNPNIPFTLPDNL